MADGDALLAGSHLTKTYRPRGLSRRAAARPAVDDVSFEVRAGQTLGVVGESGSGKSTLCRMAMRLVDPDSGTLTVCGRDITRLRGRDLKDVRPLVQMVFQNPFGSFDPLVRLDRSLAEPLVQYGLARGSDEIRARLEGLASECGLAPELLGRYPGELSGGQLQRMAIVRALCMAPRVLVADEVVSALDVVVQDEVLTLLERLVRERGMGMLLVSHDLAVIRRVSSHVIVMREGRLVDEGSVDHIFRESAVPYTRQLVSAIPSLPRG